MRYYLTLLILGTALVLSLQLVYALQPEPVPEPKPDPEHAFDYTSCGDGTTYQEGICVADETTKNPNTSSDRWGGHEHAYDEHPNLHTSPLRQILLGIPPQDILCNKGLELILRSSDGSPACVKPETKQILIERGWAKPVTIENASGSKNTEKDTVAKLLAENKIEYLPDKLVVTGGPVFRGDPRCGAVIDLNDTTHWFGIDSISNPQKMTLYSENPDQCKVNTGSCFCSAQIELTELTLNSLSYFSPEEEEKYANILIDYLGKENINRTPKFLIGKFNLNYTDPAAIGYCGELWGYNTIDYFDGAIVNGQVKDYGLAKELSSLCAISEDAKWWERK